MRPAGRGSLGGPFLRLEGGWVYVSVEELGASLQKAEELGGKMVVEPIPIPGVGAFAMFQDPEERSA